MTVATALGIVQTINVLALLVAVYVTKLGRVSMESDKPKRELKPSDVGSAWEDQVIHRPTIRQKARSLAQKANDTIREWKANK